MRNKRCILISISVACIVILNILVLNFMRNSGAHQYDISIFHNGGIDVPTYVRLSYDGQYEVYHGAFFSEEAESIPSLYYDVKKGTLSEQSTQKLLILVENLRTSYETPEAFPEVNGGMGDLTIRIDGSSYVCSLNDYDSRECKSTMETIYNIIKEEAPEFKSHYDHLIDKR